MLSPAERNHQVAPRSPGTGATASSRHALLVAIALAGLVGGYVSSRYAPYTFLERDGNFYATITRGLATGLSLDQRRWQPDSWYDGENPRYRDLDIDWSNISVGANGTWYPKHSFVMPLFAAPFYLLFGTGGLVLFNATCVFLMLLAAYLIAARFAPPVAALAAVMLTAAGPAMLEHTYHFSLDIFTAALIALGTLSLLHWRPICGGLLLGTAIWTRPTLAALVMPVAAVLAWQELTWKQALRLAVALAVPVGLAGLLNWVMFGAPWVTAYHRVLTVADGRQLIRSHSDCFSLGFAEGWDRMFLSTETGLASRSPAALLGILGLLSLWRRSWRLTAGLALAFLAYLALFLSYKYSTARFFFPWEMLLCLPLALLLEDAAALAHLAVRTLAGLARAHPRLALAGATAVCGLGLAAGLLAASGRGPGPYVLSEHIKEAKVFRNELACDYFNMRIERWECSKVEEDYWENTGLALSADECLFDKTKGPRIWFHPPKGPASKRLVFDNVPAGGTLHLRFGLADSAVSGETCFTVSYGGAKPTRLCTTRAGRLMESRVQAPPAEGLTSVELTIQSPPEAKRHLCLDGTILPAGD